MINNGLVEAVADVERIKCKNWARAILAQLYHRLSVAVRSGKKATRKSHLLLQAWTFEYGFLPPLIFKSKLVPGEHFLAPWCRGIGGKSTYKTFYREYLRKVNMSSVNLDPFKDVTNKDDWISGQCG